jgi:pyridoxal phosphate enzyme (YggS family)
MLGRVESGAIAERVSSVRQRVAAACERSGRDPKAVTIIAVSKGFGSQAIAAVAQAGITDIGENRVQEASRKVGELKTIPGLTWHMVGHLQTNKVKAALRVFDILHSVDSLHLAEEISRRASAPVPVFLEVNVAGESTKMGFSISELASAHGRIGSLPNIDVRGLMTVAPLVRDAEEARPVFGELRRHAETLGLSELSMGMSDDFEVAIDEGATYVRIGRAIFGERG